MYIENNTAIYNDIQRIIQKNFGCTADTVLRCERASNNTVYSVNVSGEKYFLKLYRSKDWPENGKISFVNHTLIKYKIPCAELIEFCRDDEKFPSGYLIEHEVQGTSADTVSFNVDQEAGFYAKLAEFVSYVHNIPMKNFGWIGDGVPEYDSMLSFFEDEFDSIAQELILNRTYTEAEISKMRDRFFETLKAFNDLPAVLCHGDLSKKNVIVSECGDLCLIDWDDAMAYNWMADIARLTFWMKFNYNRQDYSLFKRIFMEHYSTKYRKSEFDIFEKAFHIYIGLDSMIYYINMDDKDMVRHIKEYLKDIDIINESCLSNGSEASETE